MKFEVYCDEAMPDLFTSQKPKNKYLMIGSLWLPEHLRGEIKQAITQLREKHNTWGEIKWSKVSPNREAFYLALVDLFLFYQLDLRFRCIAVDHSEVDMTIHDNDGELGFYKFYYQLLHHWIFDFNEYRIFCDAKTNRDPKRLQTLECCLKNANLSATIKGIQSLKSKQVVLIQFCDLLLGAASSRINGTLKEGTAKKRLVERLERQLEINQLSPTPSTEKKYNIFKIRLGGGW